MIYLRGEAGYLPEYKTEFSAAVDLKSTESKMIQAGSSVKVGTGVFIDRVNWEQVPSGMLPELQIRARSGLALKHGIMLTNGIGTVDADYPNEICVLLFNSSSEPFEVKVGDRIAQMALNLVAIIPGVAREGKRVGGFGSTDRPDPVQSGAELH